MPAVTCCSFLRQHLFHMRHACGIGFHPPCHSVSLLILGLDDVVAGLCALCDFAIVPFDLTPQHLS